eukprot:TRINITY_DN4878_c0_g1_i8.p1 TRINITY_DN4878_c0_g1~~TRINITY_DN4878_c0_g1_i8.p1  ORF type:complete len:419 (+),score=61.89 TRINITY_DN4878_c0_g1_i8:164-1420(+)
MKSLFQRSRRSLVTSVQDMNKDLEQSPPRPHTNAQITSTPRRLEIESNANSYANSNENHDANNYVDSNPSMDGHGNATPKQTPLQNRIVSKQSESSMFIKRSDQQTSRRPLLPTMSPHSLHRRSSITMERIRTVADFTRHTVDQYWIEKAFVCIEYLQLFSVIYAITISKWGWPIWWKSQVKWVVIFNLDIWTLMDGDVSVDYNVYAVIWAVLSLVPIFLYAAWNKYYRDYDSVDDQIFRSLLPRIVIAIGRVAYLPYLLSAMRLLECRNGYLVADSKTECYKSNFTFVHVFVLVVTIVCIVALVAQYIQVIQKLRSYRQGERYETILDSKEMEYHLRLTSTWASERFYLVNSYTYYGSVYPIVNFALKALLVLFLCLISDKVMQAWVCVLVLLVHLVCSMLPYRCISSNAFSFFMNG